jgi:hypothetical protein
MKKNKAKLLFFPVLGLFLCLAVVCTSFFLQPQTMQKNSSFAPPYFDEEVLDEAIDESETLAEEIAEIHQSFIRENKDRLSFSSKINPDLPENQGKEIGELQAAKWIVDFLLQENYLTASQENPESIEAENGSAADNIVSSEGATAVSPNKSGGVIVEQTFSRLFVTQEATFFQQAVEESRYSMNVILRFRKEGNRRLVVLGTNIDNNFVKDKNEGAMESSGVAILLALAKQMQTQEYNLPFNLDIVFFGSGYVGSEAIFEGAYEYLEKGVSPTLMINIARIGGETTYVYGGETKNELTQFALSHGNFKEMPRNVPLLPTSFPTPNGYEYTHYGLYGNHVAFVGEGSKVLNFFSGDYSTLSLFDREGNSDILQNDTLENMKKAYPDAYKKMSELLISLHGMLQDTNFSSHLIIEDDITLVFMKSWIAYLALFTFVIIGFLVLSFVSKHFAGKYPKKADIQRKKVSVFGEEYDR